MSSWATPEGTRYAPARAPGGIFFNVGKGAMCIMLVVRSMPSREARHRPTPLPRSQLRDQHPRRNALEATVQADPGLRIRAARVGGGTTRDADLRSWGLWYGWDQNSLDVGPPSMSAP